MAQSRYSCLILCGGYKIMDFLTLCECAWVPAPGLARRRAGQLQKSVSSPLSPLLSSQCYQVASPPPSAHYTGLFMLR